MVSDRGSLRLSGAPLISMTGKRLPGYFRLVVIGDGSRVMGCTEESLVCDLDWIEGRRVCDLGSVKRGSRACDLDCPSGLFDFFARDGRGRLLKVLLRGIPPMGSSGRQM